MNNTPEIMAPAGSPEVLEAALAAGADSVYFGLESLNARRGAHNFTLAGLKNTMAQIHQAGAKGYVTLNIDLQQRDLGEACRYLTAAAEAGVDALIVKDLALITLLPKFPGLKFHLSTQAGISSSAGVKEAAELGFKRVVLARELSLAEIKACTNMGIELEIFVQGALCYTMSGHCLLASWGGGRSGNRGLSTSPCRVAWRAEGQDEPQRIFSMNDLCALKFVPALRDLGISCFKIEGRLKSPAWVSQAVTIYKKALAGEAAENLLPEAAALGNYGGRTMEAAYLEGRRDCLTGEWARTAATTASSHSCVLPVPLTAAAEELPVLNISLNFDERQGANWTAQIGAYEKSVRLAASPGTPAKRAINREELIDHLENFSQQYQINIPEIPADYLVPRRHLADLDNCLNTVLRLAKDGEKNKSQIKVATELLPFYRPEITRESGNLQLGEKPNLFRLAAADFEHLAQAYNKATFIITGATPGELKKFAKLAPERLLVALPTVHFEAEQEALRALAKAARENKMAIEVNSLDGLRLAKEAGFNHFIAGPGLAVLNSLATQTLKNLGASWATISPEADKAQIEELCKYSKIPLGLVVFGRPPLLLSRARPGHTNLAHIQDARNIHLTGSEDNGLWQFRPTWPLDIRGINNNNIKVSKLIMDLTGSPDPQKDILSHPNKEAPTFNYFRKLQ